MIELLKAKLITPFSSRAAAQVPLSAAAAADGDAHSRADAEGVDRIPSEGRHELRWREEASADASGQLQNLTGRPVQRVRRQTSPSEPPNRSPRHHLCHLVKVMIE